MMITADEVKEAMMFSNTTTVDHHKCSFCGWMVKYIREGEHLFFAASCNCTSMPRPARPTGWQNAADWINMQSDDKRKIELMQRFGFSQESAKTR